MSGPVPSADGTSHQQAGMPLRLVRGDASPEELAALVAVLAGSTAADDADPAPRHTSSAWVSRARLVRAPQHHGPGGWRASALPRH